MINREDMLELTRRMTPKRTSLDRIAGGYMDCDGFIDGSFNVNFLKARISIGSQFSMLIRSIRMMSCCMRY